MNKEYEDTSDHNTTRDISRKLELQQLFAIVLVIVGLVAVTLNNADITDGEGGIGVLMIGVGYLWCLVVRLMISWQRNHKE
jgi:hypothetical protein